MKILLAVDGSEYSKKMLTYLVTHKLFVSSTNDYHVFNAHPALPARASAVVGKKWLINSIKKNLKPFCLQSRNFYRDTVSTQLVARVRVQHLNS